MCLMTWLASHPGSVHFRECLQAASTSLQHILDRLHNTLMCSAYIRVDSQCCCPRPDTRTVGGS